MAQDENTAPKNMKISATDENYPKYEISLDGDLVVVQGSHITRPISIRGPHAFLLPSTVPNVDIKVELTHKDADPGVPNLNITIRRKRPDEQQ